MTERADKSIKLIAENKMKRKPAQKGCDSKDDSDDGKKNEGTHKSRDATTITTVKTTAMIISIDNKRKRQTIRKIGQGRGKRNVKHPPQVNVNGGWGERAT